MHLVAGERRVKKRKLSRTPKELLLARGECAAQEGPAEGHEEEDAEENGLG
jgi:hypothetical protein